MNGFRKFGMMCCIVFSCAASAQTVGLIQHDASCHNGFLLMSPIASNATYLINSCGESIHEWTSAYKPGLSAHLLPDGSIMRTGNLNNTAFGGGGAGGVVERLAWDNTVLWQVTISDANTCQHHDVFPLDGDRFLVLVWEKKSIDEALAMGRTVNTAIDFVWSEMVQEIAVTGPSSYEVVWEWKAWDHLVQDVDAALPNYSVVADSPRSLDINYVSGPPANEDWIHLNSIDYNATLDQIVVSAHNFSELWIIDHSTTTTEAATGLGGTSGFGGDLLFRWGNPQVYDQGTPNLRRLYGQHHVTWIPSDFPHGDQLLLFNNGLNRPQGDYSSIERIVPPWNGTSYDLVLGEAFGPTNADWTYTAPTPESFYSANISGVYPTQDGSLLITDGTGGRCFQIDEQSNVLWEYVNPVAANVFLSTTQAASNNTVFRFAYYPANYAGILEPNADGVALELDAIVPSLCDVQGVAAAAEPAVLSTIREVLVISCDASWSIYNLVGQLLLSGYGPSQIPLDAIPQNVFVVQLNNRVYRLAKG